VVYSDSAYLHDLLKLQKSYFSFEERRITARNNNLSDGDIEKTIELPGRHKINLDQKITPEFIEVTIPSSQCVRN
jgi:hypothetical protein